MTNATLAKVGVLIVLLLGGMLGAGMVLRNYFASGDKEVNDRQDKRIESVETNDKAQDTKLNDHSLWLSRHDGEIKTLHNTDKRHDEAHSKHDANHADQEQRLSKQGEDIAKLGAETQSLKGEISRMSETLDAERRRNEALEKKLEDERRIRDQQKKDTENRLRRLERMLGVEAEQ